MLHLSKGEEKVQRLGKGEGTRFIGEFLIYSDNTVSWGPDIEIQLLTAKQSPLFTLLFQIYASTKHDKISTEMG